MALYLSPEKERSKKEAESPCSIRCDIGGGVGQGISVLPPRPGGKSTLVEVEAKREVGGNCGGGKLREDKG